MKYVEEHHATDLHQSLIAQFADGALYTEIGIEGGGVHWSCFAKRGTRSCTVACFDSEGPEYYSDFEQDNQEMANGRTSSKSDTIAAVASWLDEDDLAELYLRFEHVDREKRELIAIAASIIEYSPDLDRIATHFLQHQGADMYRLKFKAADRSCRVGANAVFEWDESEMFRTQTDDYRKLAGVMERWLCDGAPPSAIRAEFDWIELGPLAKYYEQGRPMEGEFIESWNAMERFYQERADRKGDQVLAFLSAIRRAGFDSRLRAGQSIWSLVVSRSRRHGLRRGQPYIVFEFPNNSLVITENIDTEDRFTLPQIKLTPQIEELLERLAVREID